MKKLLLSLLLVFVVLAGCNSSSPDPSVLNSAVEATILAMPSVTPYPTFTPYPTYTPFPSPTVVLPTATSVPTATLSANPLGIIGVAKNHLGSLEQKGVVVEILRVIIGDAQQFDYSGWKHHEDFDTAKTMVELLVSVTNNTKGKISFLGLDYGLVAINGEQVELNQYYSRYGFSPRTSDLMAGVSMERGLWFPIYNSDWDQVKEIQLSLVGAFNDSGIGFTNDFNFTVPVEGWGFEPKP